MTERTNIWSFGGGVQSQGMLALMLKGRLPLPKHVVMADTGRERSLVWDYIEEVSRSALKTLGLELEIISHEDFATGRR